MRNMKLTNVILPGRDIHSRWDVGLESNTVTSIIPSSAELVSTPASLVLPPLCHPHIHLDKPYLLTCNSDHYHLPRQPEEAQPTYTDLTPQDGSFSEALTFTSRAKQRYTSADLYLRGSQLLATSLAQGVTSCRAFVELDHVTSRSCLEAAVHLKNTFQGKFRLQICAFAQDPIFSSEHGQENRQVLTHALRECGAEVDVLGTTPYVEKSPEASLENIEWAIETALTRSLHLDFHLDYNLDESQRPMVWDVVRLLKELNWNGRAKAGKTIVLGHCTRLALCTDVELAELAREIKDSGLPIHFVGLPTSDLFMMARPVPQESSEKSRSAHRARGTLQVLDMINRFGFSACLSVNNVGNAFTPWGTGDPISLASLGVGIYQAGTTSHAQTLFECVSSRARAAIGLPTAPMSDTDSNAVPAEEAKDSVGIEDVIELKEGRKGELLVIRNEEWVGCPGHLGVKIPARQRVHVRDVVWDPPEVRLRQVLRCV